MDWTWLLIPAGLLLVAFLWVQWRISRAYKDAGSIGQLLNHPCFGAEAAEGVRSLLILNGDLKKLVAPEAPRDDRATVAFGRTLSDYQKKHESLRLQLRDARPSLREMVRAHGRREGWIGWKRWSWVIGRIGVGSGLLNTGLGRLQQGNLNIADPDESEAAVQEALPGSRYADLRVTVKERTAYLRYTAPQNTIPRTTRPERDIGRDYVALVASSARDAIDLAFRAVAGLDGVAVSVFERRTHELQGHSYNACVLSVTTDRTGWRQIVHANVTAENALRNFGLRLRYNKAYVLQEVGYSDPKDLDPIAFEHLVRELLQHMGFVATTTKTSGDGGIDVEAENHDPVVGGRIIVQCKRYQGAVGSPAVRDLYGALTDARAMKGILITTADFSPDARRFAEGKPLELVNGTKLRELLNRYGLLANTTGIRGG
jgi:hypothetical protein